MQFTHALKYYLAIKGNEVLIHATTWINLENIIISDRSQAQKAAQSIIPLIYDMSRIGKSIETEDNW